MDPFTLNKLGQIRQREILDQMANPNWTTKPPLGLSLWRRVSNWLVTIIRQQRQPVKSVDVRGCDDRPVQQEVVI